jgi:endoglycosylceramidase
LQRELGLAVRAAFAAFWINSPGPGGIGIRTRYAQMLGHVAGFFAKHDAVAGYEIMNEPNAFWIIPGQLEALAELYADSIVEIRKAEAAASAPRRLVFFEPAITWADFGPGAPPDFPKDDQVVYAPHIYQGGISPVPLSPEVFEVARSDAAYYGGTPVYSSEWGSGPERAGAVPTVWGFFAVDCSTNTVNGMRDAFVRRMSRPYLRAAPGPLDQMLSDPATGLLEASGSGARPWGSFIAFVPASESGKPPSVEGTRMHWLHTLPGAGGSHYVVGLTEGGAWSLRIMPR